MDFPARLRNLRKKQGISQNKLAKDIGVSQSAVGYWERGEKTPSVEITQKIADYFNTSITYLMTGKEFSEFDIPPGKVRIEIEGKVLDVNPIEFIEHFNNVAKQVHPSNVSNLLSSFFILNTKGQNKAVEQVEMLTKIPEYTKDYNHSAKPDAAYNRTNANVTEDVKKNDDIVDPDKD